MSSVPAFAVLGARNLGGAIVKRLMADGWGGAVVARSEETLASVRGHGALAIAADAADASSLADALSRKSDLGRIDLLINAVSVARFDPEVPWGGGPIAQATPDRFEAWSAAVTRQAFVALSEGARALEPPARFIQVANSSSSKVTPGQGLWAAGWHGVRALTLAAAGELADDGIGVTLLVVDGPIRSPKTEAMVANLPPQMVHEQDDVAAAVARLAGEPAPPSELVLSPA